MILIYNYRQNNHREGPNTGCQNGAIEAFPVMIATRGGSTPLLDNPPYPIMAPFCTR